MAIPAKQDNYQIAVDQAFAQVVSRSPAQLEALGAKPDGASRCRLPVLNAEFTVDLAAKELTFSMPAPEGPAEGPVGVMWQILALHYLCGPAPETAEPQWRAFADFPDIRGYESVFKGRVIGRLCATAGRSEKSFVAAAERLGGQPAEVGDLGYRFDVFPHAPLLVAWYADDGELPPNATVLYPDNIQRRLPLEDVVVLPEALVSRLQGKGW